MKSKMTILLVLSCMLSMGGVALAQNAPIDFEAGGYGADWTWTVFENETNPALEIVANPSASGVNTSATVAMFTALQAGQPWAGCESLHGTDIGTYSISAANSTIKIMVYKTVLSDVGIKLVKPDGWSLGEIKVANTVTNEWEELTFDFTSQMQDGYDQIVVFPDFDLNGRTQDNVVYFDNITFSEGGGVEPGEEPEVAAPTPAHDASSVISLFSNPYTDVTVDTWSAAWDNADVQDVVIAGDDVKLYTSFGFAGIEFTSQTVDATAMTSFHMDIWTPDAIGTGAFHVKLVDFGADGVWSGGDDTESMVSFNAYTTPALVSGEWVRIDIPMSSFSALASQAHLAQMVIEGDPNTVYVDNVYFHSNPASIDDRGALPFEFVLEQNFPNPFNPSTTIRFSLENPEYVRLKVFNVAGQEVASLFEGQANSGEHTLQFEANNFAAGTYFYSLTVGQQSSVKKMVLVK